MKQLSNNKTILCAITYLTLMLSLYGCSSIKPGNNAISTETSMQGGADTTPASASATVLSTTATHSQTAPASGNQITDLKRRCLDPQPTQPPTDAKSDSVYFVTPFGSEDADYFWDMDTNQLFPIPVLQIGAAFGGGISPNRQWIAFEINYLDDNRNITERNLEVFDAYGNQKVALPWKNDWGSLRGWLENERLYTEGYGTNLGTIFVIYPFTGQVQELFSNIPNIYDDYPPAVWSVAPNSDLTLALYPNNSSQGQGVGYTLWDMVERKKIWHQDSRTAPDIPPFWSPDWTQFGVVAEESATLENQAEILIFDSSGHSILQTDFSSNYSYVFIGKYLSWSPDGRYLTFWLSVGSSDNPPQTTSLSVFDLKEKKVTDYCIKSYGSGNKLVWVQDGRWLITWSDEVSSNILIDLLANEAYLFPVPVSGAIDGWMTKPDP